MLRPELMSRRRLYPAVGLILAALTLLGLLGLRRLLAPDAGLDVLPLHRTSTYLTILALHASVLTICGRILGRRQDRLEAEVASDPLTGLHNRRYLLARLDSGLRRRARRPAALTLLVVNIDHLKGINDRHGHAAGDRALLAVAACMQQVGRRSDVLARLGGDAFAILAPDISAAQGRELAARLRAALRQICLLSGPLTVSVGVGAVPAGPTPGAAALLAAAVAALDQAKAGGRDQVGGDDGCRPRTGARARR